MISPLMHDEPHEPTASSGIKVVLVDDHRVVRQGLSMILRKDGPSEELARQILAGAVVAQPATSGA